MEENLFYKIIDEISSWKVKVPVGLYNMGDSLLHKKLIPHIHYISAKGLEGFLSTNGFNLNHHLQKELPNSGLKQITFSFEGENPEQYEQIRKNSSYEVVKNNILSFLEHNKNRILTTILVIKFGENESLEISDDFKRIFKDYKVNFYAYHASDWRGTLDIDILKKNTDGVPKKEMCSHIYCPAIDWNGNFIYCTLDYNADDPIGNVKEHTVFDLFNSKKMSRIRSIMERGCWHTLPLCKTCSAPSTEDSKPRLQDDGNESNYIDKDIRSIMIEDGTWRRS